ncbi:serine hydrolase domain-containing protein [Nocardioides sp. NPDC057577]|uniref:serine hydrolase domain-containing protein n=1 Tax=Nocardioides sp. NPDC057577 TaxID=3346171 RepID=UPI00366FF4E6
MTLQRRVQYVLDELVSTGAETGLQVAVDHRGRRVVEAVAGVADSGTGRPVAAETLFFSFSTGKGMAALVAHLLVGKGLVGYDTPVAEVWPEFGVHGKESATLRHVLTHTVGVPAMPRGLGPGDLADWNRVCAALAEAVPLWAPGTRTGYHSFTFGFLIGEIARRITGKPMGRLLEDWVAAPLEVTGELRFGVPPSDLARLARLEDGEPPPAEAAEPDGVLAPWERRPRASMGNDPRFLRAEVPSVGTFTARGITTAYAAMLDGRLISPEQLEELSAVAFEGTDQVFGTPAQLALGYPAGRIGWPGGGGSYAYADPATGISFAITKNRLTPDFSTAQRLADLVTTEIAPPA